MIQDLINGFFEFSGAIFILLSIIKLYKDKMVHGVQWLTILYFFSWGLWNLYYYPHLGQTISFCGGIAITICNFIWFSQILYYLKKNS
jgi:hypothetical protein